jgi:hypothetical protein
MIKNLGPTLRSWSQFHENEKLIGWLQRQPAVAWLTPERRRTALFLGAMIIGLRETYYTCADWLGYGPNTTRLAALLVFPVFVGMLYLLYLAAAHFQKLPAVIRRRPQATLHLGFWAILGILWLTPGAEGQLWWEFLVLTAVLIPFLIWRVGYMWMSGQRGKARNTRFRDHFFYLWPLWGGSNTPAGKGWDYLSQCEAKTPESYARSMLAGLRLMCVVLVLELVKVLLAAILYAPPKNIFARLLGGRHLDVPRLKDIVAGKATASLFTTWASLYVELIWDVVRLATRGHKWVAALRAFGFNVLRNTYKPLLAESLVDFWNRYYYYFKELLVEFFFYPTYLRWFRAWPRLRMFAAVFAAAFVGNMYYHFIQRVEDFVADEWGELWDVCLDLTPRLVYCLSLALGIYFSMLRQQKRRGRRERPASAIESLVRLRRIAGVWTFFSLINYWNTDSDQSMIERMRFFLALFGL